MSVCLLSVVCLSVCLSVVRPDIAADLRQMCATSYLLAYETKEPRTSTHRGTPPVETHLPPLFLVVCFGAGLFPVSVCFVLCCCVAVFSLAGVNSVWGLVGVTKVGEVELEGRNFGPLQS